MGILTAAILDEDPAHVPNPHEGCTVVIAAGRFIGSVGRVKRLNTARTRAYVRLRTGRVLRMHVWNLEVPYPHVYG